MLAPGLVVPWVAEVANECLVTQVLGDTQMSEMTQRAKSSSLAVPHAQGYPLLLPHLGHFSIPLA